MLRVAHDHSMPAGKPLFRLFGVALVLALLAGCGRGSSTPTPQPATSNQTPGESAGPAAGESTGDSAAETPDNTPTPAGTPTPINPDKTIITESGLQYTEITPGDGPQPQPNDIVVVHYTAALEDGSVFENSYDRGEPARFSLDSGQVLPGWKEGISMMNQGEQAILVIPPDLAYGEEGAGQGRIPPNATLILDVELVEVQPGAPDAPAEVDPDRYTTAEQGFRYVDLVEGDGPKPMPGQEVVVHYTGWLAEGGTFDSSLDRGEPYTFNLGMGQVIPGWDLGVAGMNVGGKRQLVIPPELAYGEEGAGQGLIPPNATLIFEVELLEVR